jgi:hypothetical protein
MFNMTFKEEIDCCAGSSSIWLNIVTTGQIIVP